MLEDASFAVGSLRVMSYARPGKLFTANSTLMVTQVGTLNAAALRQIIEAVVALLQASLRP
jgi:mRNA interferase MazF